MPSRAALLPLSVALLGAVLSLLLMPSASASAAVDPPAADSHAAGPHGANGTNGTNSSHGANGSNGGCPGDHGAHDPAHESHQALLSVFFPFLALGVGMVTRHLMAQFPVPYTSLQLIFGIGLGLLLYIKDFECTDFGKALMTFTTMDPHMMMNIFLPPLIFESAFSIEWHIFKKVVVQCTCVAVPGLLIASALTGLVVKALYMPWDIIWCFLVGSVLSATDPVAVVSLLKEMGAPKSLGTFIEGESLLNDGTAVVVFTVLLEAARGGVSYVWDPGQVIGIFLQMSIGGPLWGLAVGIVSVQFISRVFNDAEIEVTTTIVAAYLTFFLAEFYLKVSGVLAVVALGLYFGHRGRTSISPEVEHGLHQFWELLGFMANTLIFIITGLIIADSLKKGIEPMDIAKLFAIYAALNVIRFLCLLLFWTCVRKIGYGLSFGDVCVSTWGGLRGAVGLALALVIKLDVKLGNIMTPVDPHAQNKMLFMVAGIVFLTLNINALTVGRVLSFFEMDKVHHSKEVYVFYAQPPSFCATRRAPTTLPPKPVHHDVLCFVVFCCVLFVLLCFVDCLLWIWYVCISFFKYMFSLLPPLNKKKKRLTKRTLSSSPPPRPSPQVLYARRQGARGRRQSGGAPSEDGPAVQLRRLEGRAQVPPAAAARQGGLLHA